MFSIQNTAGVSAADGFDKRCLGAWVVLGTLLMSVPFVCGSPAGAWVPGGFGSHAYILLIAVVMLPQRRAPDSRQGVRLRLLLVGFLALALLCLEAWMAHVLLRDGVAAYQSYVLEVPAWAPVRMALRPADFAPQAEHVLSLGALLAWGDAGVVCLARQARHEATAACTSKVFLSLLGLSCVLGFLSRAVPSIVVSLVPSDSFGLVLSSATSLLAAAPLLLCFSLYNRGVVLERGSERIVVGHATRYVGLAAAVGALLWSVVDVLAWLVETGDSDATYWLAFGCAAALAVLFVLVLAVYPGSLMRRDELDGLNDAGGLEKAAPLKDEEETAEVCPSRTRYLPVLLDVLPGSKALSNREADVLEALLQGKSQSETAAMMHVSSSAVGSYRARAYQKLGVASKQELVSLIEPQVLLDSGRVGSSAASSTNEDSSQGSIRKCLERAALFGWVCSLAASLPVSAESSFFIAGIGMVCVVKALRMTVDGMFLRECPPPCDGAAADVLGVGMTSLLCGMCVIESDLSVYSSIGSLGMSSRCAIALLAGLSAAFALAPLLERHVCKDRLSLPSEWRKSLLVSAALVAVELAVGVVFGKFALLVASSAVLLVVLLLLRARGGNDLCPTSTSADAGDWVKPAMWRPVLFMTSFAAAAGIRLEIYPVWEATGVLSVGVLFAALLMLCMDYRRKNCQTILMGISVAFLSFLGVPRVSAEYWGLICLVLVLACSLLWLQYVMQMRKRQRSAAERLADRSLHEFLSEYGLTEVQIQIIILTAIGCSARTVAHQLCLSKDTVASYRVKAYKRLGVHDKKELRALLEKGGL